MPTRGDGRRWSPSLVKLRTRTLRLLLSLSHPLVLYRLPFLMPPRLSSQLRSLNSLHAVSRSPSVAHTRSLVTGLNLRPTHHAKAKPRLFARAGPSVRRMRLTQTPNLMDVESVPCVDPERSTQGPLQGARCQEGRDTGRSQEDLFCGMFRNDFLHLFHR